jgi:Zn-dependent M28 family amino/carboxypeptidase
MRTRLALTPLLATVALLACDNASFPQNAPPAPAANNAPVAFQMTMGDMMNTLIQPRHAKLGLAGHDENWPLANYAIREIQQSFTAITKSIPRWRGLPVPELVEAAVGQPIKAVAAAIKQKDTQKFAEAYSQLTQGCNACHATSDHQFVVIKAPDASNFPNQDFSARQ